jgi:hypothetical protein
VSKNLTDRQREVLQFIKDFVAGNGFPPSIREIGKALSIGSLRGVTVHLDALVRKGYITRQKLSRGIALVSQTTEQENVSINPDVHPRILVLCDRDTKTVDQMLWDPQNRNTQELQEAWDTKFKMTLDMAGVISLEFAPSDWNCQRLAEWLVNDFGLVRLNPATYLF